MPDDLALAGIRIPAGTIVSANTAAANRDSAAFSDPDRFDITRDNAVGMLSFGNGAHYCLGSHLARLELTQALTVMAQRIPNVRRTGAAPWPSMIGVTGPSTVPIAFGLDDRRTGMSGTILNELGLRYTPPLGSLGTPSRQLPKRGCPHHHATPNRLTAPSRLLEGV